MKRLTPDELLGIETEESCLDDEEWRSYRDALVGHIEALEAEIAQLKQYKHGEHCRCLICEMRKPL